MEELGIESGYRVLNLRFVGFELGRVGNVFLGKTMLGVLIQEYLKNEVQTLLFEAQSSTSKII